MVLGRVKPQGSLLETRHMRRHLVTKGSFYERLANHGDEIVSDEDFADLYAPRMGRPSIPPSVMVRAMLCATHDKTSDEETSRRSRVDADWKAAMGVDDDFLGIGATTFSLMRARMLAHDADATLFEKTLQKAVAKGILRGKLTAIIDSSPVHGAGAVADTYELIRGFLRQVVRGAGDRLSSTSTEASQPFCGAKPDIDWQDPAARKAHLGELVAVARSVLDEVRNIKDPAVAEPAGLLAQVIDSDTHDDDEGKPTIRKGVARDRIVSHSDPEMRHGRKSASRRFDGHKMDVLTDEESELILGVDVRGGNAAEVCAACALRASCTTGADGRSVAVGVHEARIAAARAAQVDPAIKALLRRRCKVERKIDHLQDLGMRQSRYRGRRKTRLQALLAATVANFQRLAVLGAFAAAPELARAA